VHELLVLHLYQYCYCFCHFREELTTEYLRADSLSVIFVWYNPEVLHRHHSAIAPVHIIFRMQCVGKCTICLHTKFLVPSFNGTLLVDIKQKI
jgi:hypothetical protein